MTPPRSYQYSVGSGDVDSTLRARLTAIVNILFETAGEDARVMGVGTDRLSGMNLGWILSRMRVETLRRPSIFEKFTVSTWLSEINTVVNTRNFIISDAEGQVVVRCRSIWCLLDHAARRPVRQSVLGVDLENSLSAEQPPCQAPEQIILSGDFPEAFTHTVRYTDIDVNDHLNSLRYMDMVSNALPRDVAQSPASYSFDLHFVRECHFGEVLSVRSLGDGNSFNFVIARPDGSPAMEAVLKIGIPTGM